MPRKKSGKDGGDGGSSKVGNPNWKAGGKSPNPHGRPKKDHGIIELARKSTHESIRALEKMRDGTAVPWAIRLEATLALLAYGHGKPQQNKSFEHSGPGGEPLKTSPSVFIYNSIEEAQIAAAAGAGDELPPMVFLPSNGYEVRLKPDGTPEQALGEEDNEPRPLAPCPSSSKEASDLSDAELLEHLSDEELLNLAAEHGIEVSR